MPNTFLTPDIIANEALMVLENNTVMAGLVHRDYSKEFNRVGDTITIRKPAKFIAKNFVGETSEQSATEGSTTVTLDHFRDVTVPVTSKELSSVMYRYLRCIVANRSGGRIRDPTQSPCDFSWR